MIFYAYYDSQGRYVQSGAGPEPIRESDIPRGCQVYYGVVDITTQYHDIVNNIPVNLPISPGETYTFNYATKAWELNEEQAKQDALYKRNNLLIESDWTQLPNNPLTVEKQQLWAIYRQALRDITTQSGYPRNIVWPIKPN